MSPARNPERSFAVARTALIQCAAALAAVVWLMVAAGCATAPPPAGHAAFDLPSPLEGPGRPDLDRAAQRALARGWADLQAGRPDAAAAQAGDASATTAGRLLALQAKLEQGDTPTKALSALVADAPGYAAAWVTLSIAAERGDDEATALEAARRAAELWPHSRWRSRADELSDRWVDGRIQAARTALDAGNAETALSDAEKALKLARQRSDAGALAARALLALDRVDDAAAQLEGLPASAERTFMEGEIAERRGDLTTAMERYDSLPSGYPGRNVAVMRAQLGWRLANAPEWVHDALASPHIDRAQLAALLVTMIPGLEGIEGGAVPLITDVVDLPMCNDILLTVRLGVLEADPVERRFFPERPVTAAEVGDALDAVSHLLGLPPPVWCKPAQPAQAGCMVLPHPPSGRAVADLVLAVQGGEPS
jgi:tetratricopeptide (TPR) repeat protein